MKLLYQMEATVFYNVDKKRYYYRAAPGRLIYVLHKYFDEITICAPVIRGFSFDNKHHGGWLCERFLRIESLPYWEGILGFFRIGYRNLIKLLSIARENILRNDIVLLKLPSISSIIFFILAKQHKKTIILHIDGNIKNAWKDKGCNFFKQIFFFIGAHLLHFITLFMARYSLKIMPGHELLDLYSRDRTKALPFIGSQIRQKDMFYMRDKCNKNSIVLLYVGSVVGNKGIYELLTSFKELLDSGYRLDLEIIGTGREEERLKNQIQYRGLSEHVRFRGFVPLGRRLFRIYKEADIFVLPTYYPEGFPRVIVEAWSFSLPVITCDTGGITTLVKNNETGILISPRSSGELSCAIKRIIEDRTLRQNLMRNGFKVAQDYTTEAQLENLLNFLTENTNYDIT